MPPPDDAYYAALDALIRPLAAARLPAALDGMRALLAALGHPERAFPVIIVAGSTGKGTTALRLAAGLAAGGRRIGLYTSPHLHSFRERFAVLEPETSPLGSNSPPSLLSVHGKEERTETGHVLPLSAARRAGGEEPGVRATLITPAAFTAHARAVLATAAAQGLTPSTFESATALAFRWFVEQRVDLVVGEIGLGGRFDAVNAAPHVLALIGPIEREHAAMLGGTLERIAWHKAGVITPGSVAIAVPPSEPAVREALESEAAEQGAALSYADDLAVAGLAALQRMGLTAETPPIPSGVALPGRLERGVVRGRRVLVDGGHTPLAAARLAAALVPDLPGRVCLIAGMLADKDAAAWLRELDAPGLTLICVTPPADRALPAADLAAAYAPQSARVQVIADFTQALEQAFASDASLIGVAGSLRLAAAAREAFGWLTAKETEEAERTRALFAGPGYRARWGG